jgi:membrane protein insertase Oxa1/YidC/SpoIIIJ
VDRVAGCRINIGEITMTVDDAIIYAEQKLGLTVDDAFDFLEMVLDSEDFQQWLRGLEAYAKSVKAAAGLNWGWSIAAIPNSQS